MEHLSVPNTVGQVLISNSKVLKVTNSPSEIQGVMVHIPKQNLLVKHKPWAWKEGDKTFDHPNSTQNTKNNLSLKNLNK